MSPDANAVRKSQVGNKKPVTKQKAAPLRGLSLTQQVSKPVVKSDKDEEEETLSEKKNIKKKSKKKQ